MFFVVVPFPIDTHTNKACIVITMPTDWLTDWRQNVWSTHSDHIMKTHHQGNGRYKFSIYPNNVIKDQKKRVNVLLRPHLKNRHTQDKHSCTYSHTRNTRLNSYNSFVLFFLKHFFFGEFISCNIRLFRFLQERMNKKKFPGTLKNIC